MPEINGNPVEVGDVILIATQVGTITQYDELADRMTYVLGEGTGTNFVQGHISNTPFRKIVVSDHTTLAEEQHDELEARLENVNFSSVPVEEDPDTDRVKGEPGAKMAGVPTEGGANDEVISG